MTGEKHSLAAIIETTEQPFDPEDVISEMTGHHGMHRVSRSTVYRLFSELDEAGLIGGFSRFSDHKAFVRLINPDDL